MFPTYCKKTPKEYNVPSPALQAHKSASGEEGKKKRNGETTRPLAVHQTQLSDSESGQDLHQDQKLRIIILGTWDTSPLTPPYPVQKRAGNLESHHFSPSLLSCHSHPIRLRNLLFSLSTSLPVTISQPTTKCSPQ